MTLPGAEGEVCTLDETSEREIHVQESEVGEGEPLESVVFRSRGGDYPEPSHEQEIPDIVMQVRRKAFVRGDGVNVEIDWRWLPDTESIGWEAHFFGSFAKSDGEGVALAWLGVSPELKPFIELGVKAQTHASVIGIDDERAARDVAAGVVAIERVGDGSHEGQHSVLSGFGNPIVGREGANGSQDERFASLMR